MTLLSGGWRRGSVLRWLCDPKQFPVSCWASFSSSVKEEGYQELGKNCHCSLLEFRVQRLDTGHLSSPNPTHFLEEQGFAG